MGNNATKCVKTHNVMEWSDCLECAAKRKIPDCPLPYALLKKIAPDPNFERKGIHVSDLLNCLRKAWYREKVGDPPEYPNERLAMTLGTLIHNGLEAKPGDPNLRSEIDLAMRFGNVTVYGRTDGYEPATQTLIDFKTKKGLDLKYIPSGDHALQIRIYAMMLEAAGTPVKRCVINYIDLAGASQCQSCKKPLVQDMASHWLVCRKCGNHYDPQVYHLGSIQHEVAIGDLESLARWVGEKANHLNDAIQAGFMADAKPGWLCKYCPHAEQCPDAKR